MIGTLMYSKEEEEEGSIANETVLVAVFDGYYLAQPVLTQPQHRCYPASTIPRYLHMHPVHLFVQRFHFSPPAFTIMKAIIINHLTLPSKL